MFTQAVVRTPSRSLVNGLTTARLGPPDYELALAQHDAYRAALETCGVAVTVLPPAEEYPDAVFVEDTALCTSACAVITRPGAPSRRREAELIEPELRRFYDRIERIEAPGTLDAGDVMMVGDGFYLGRSARSNAEGVRQLAAILERHGFNATAVPLQEVLHLKTGLAYLEHNNLLVAGEFADARAFDRYNRIAVPQDEAYAANSIWVNERVIMPAGYPHTRERVEALGYDVIPIDVSEFRKLDGGVSCLSLRF